MTHQGGRSDWRAWHSAYRGARLPCENCGADGWAMTPAGLRGVVNDAVAIYFLDATSAAAFVSRWCAGSEVEIREGAFQVREDHPARRISAAPHKTF